VEVQVLSSAPFRKRTAPYNNKRSNQSSKRAVDGGF